MPRLTACSSVSGYETRIFARMRTFDSGTERRKADFSPWAGVGVLVTLCAILYLPPAVTTPFFTKGEPREALVVRRMVEQGDWVLPKRSSANGWTIASKPPFFHWLAATTTKAWGRPTEFALRLPSVALGTAAVVAVWLVGRSLVPPTAALWAAIVLATTFEWLRAVSSARVDGTLAALMTGALLLFYRGVLRGGLSRREALVAYGLLVCATLTKGPVGFLLPGLVLGTALLMLRKWALIPRFHPILGALVIIAGVSSWYVAGWQLGGDSFYRKHILKENVFRFLGASAMKSGHEHGLFYYLPTFAAGFLPWTLFLVAALIRAVRNPRTRRDPRIAFPLVWFAVVFLFYSAASAKRSVYLLALYPAAALLVGWWWNELRTAEASPRCLGSRGAQLVVIVISAAVLLPLALVVAEGVGFAPLTRLAPLLHPKDQANLPLVRDIIDTHFLAVSIGLAAMLAALGTALAALRRSHWETLFAASGVLAVALWTLVFAIFQPALARQRTLGPFVVDAGWRAGGRPLYFSPGTFDFGAAFYAPAGTRIWRHRRDHGPGPHYLLVWDDQVATVPRVGTDPPEIVAVSAGTDPKGRRHLALVRFP
jgi:hypothetical protein